MVDATKPKIRVQKTITWDDKEVKDYLKLEAKILSRYRNLSSGIKSILNEWNKDN